MSSQVDKEYIIVEEIKGGYKVQFGLDVHSRFEAESKTHHVACGSLGVSAYDEDEDEALEGFTEVVHTFIEYAIESDQLDLILKECGFKKLEKATPYHNIYIRKIRKAVKYFRDDFGIKVKGKARRAVAKESKKRVTT
jgi:hypothetical protein